MHELEFVRPIQEVVSKVAKCKVKSYRQVTKRDLRGVSKIILSGTSLQDIKYLQHLEKFKAIAEESIKKKIPSLGICAGCQVLGLLEGAKLERLKKAEIGLVWIKLQKDFFNLKKGLMQVYCLHQSFLSWDKQLERKFEVIAYSKVKNKKVPQIIKHREKPWLGLLFHPEVRQKELIKKFVSL